MRTRYVVESVDNALQLLLVLQSDGELRLSRAADELGVAPSTAHRLLGTLVGRGFAVQDGRRRYLPGPNLPAAPHSRREHSDRLRRLAARHLRELSRDTGETAHLLVRERTTVRFVASAEGPQALRIGSRVGVTLPAHVTSGGRAILAATDRSEVARLYRETLPPDELARLLRALGVVRQRGYGTNTGRTERGLTAVGVCVRAGDGRPLAALTVSAPTMRLPTGRIAGVATALAGAVAGLEADLAG